VPEAVRVNAVGQLGPDPDIADELETLEKGGQVAGRWCACCVA